ncbi:hypothetical protein ACFE04_004133 [Oxalis oulophora]
MRIYTQSGIATSARYPSQLPTKWKITISPPTLNENGNLSMIWKGYKEDNRMFRRANRSVFLSPECISDLPAFQCHKNFSLWFSGSRDIGVGSLRTVKSTKLEKCKKKPVDDLLILAGAKQDTTYVVHLWRNPPPMHSCLTPYRHVSVPFHKVDDKEHLISRCKGYIASFGAILDLVEELKVGGLKCQRNQKIIATDTTAHMRQVCVEDINVDRRVAQHTLPPRQTCAGVTRIQQQLNDRTCDQRVATPSEEKDSALEEIRDLMKSFVKKSESHESAIETLKSQMDNLTNLLTKKKDDEEDCQAVTLRSGRALPERRRADAASGPVEPIITQGLEDDDAGSMEEASIMRSGADSGARASDMRHAPAEDHADPGADAPGLRRQPVVEKHSLAPETHIYTDLPMKNTSPEKGIGPTFVGPR